MKWRSSSGATIVGAIVLDLIPTSDHANASIGTSIHQVVDHGVHRSVQGCAARLRGNGDLPSDGRRTPEKLEVADPLVGRTRCGMRHGSPRRDRFDAHIWSLVGSRQRSRHREHHLLAYRPVRPRQMDEALQPLTWHR
jgi:hypothetical protein